MGTYGSFQTDKDMEKKGIELDLGEAGIFKLARAGGSNTRFAKRLEALTKPHRRAIQAGTMDNQVAEKLMAEAYADCVILGWEKVTGPDGELLEFSRENCIQIMTDLPDLFRTIRDTAEDANLYRSVVREEDAGN